MKKANLAEKMLSRLALKSAKTAAGTASMNGFCQPKEPSFAKKK